MRENFNITNKRVREALKEAKKSRKGSKLVEDAILYYLDSIEKEYITKCEVKGLILDCLKDISVAGPISNANYIDTKEQLSGAIEDILEL